MAKTAIERRDFGFTGILALDAGGLVIGERIDIMIEIEAETVGFACSLIAPSDQQPRGMISLE